MSQAIRIPESKKEWSSRKDALQHVRKCLASLKKNGELSQDEIDQFWALDADLTNRKHTKVALCLREIYWEIDSGTCPDVKGRLKTLLKVLQAANVRRKQQLALKKAGISKDQ